MDIKIKRKKFWTVFSILLAALSIWAVLSQSKSWSPADIIDKLQEANTFWIAAAVISAALFVFFEGAAIGTLLDGIGYRRPFRQSLLYSTSDIYFSAITPSATGGQPASAYFMIRNGVPAGTTTVVLLVNLILYTLSILALGAVSLVIDHKMIHAFRLSSKILIFVGMALLSGLVVLFFLFLGRGPKVFDTLKRFVTFLNRHGIVRGLKRRLRQLDETQEEFQLCSEMMKGRSKYIVRAFLYNLAQRASQIAVPVFVHLALGGRKILAGQLFASQCLANIGYNCVPVPGAMGVADYLMVDAFSSLIGMDEALLLEMISRGLQFYLCVAVSGIITAIGFSLSKRKTKN